MLSAWTKVHWAGRRTWIILSLFFLAPVSKVRARDHPRPLDQAEVGIIDDPHLNAASAGGEFYVTTGLL